MLQDCYVRIGRGRIAGCVPLTVSLLSSLYALPQAEEPDLLAVLQGIGDGFPWAGSLLVAPEQTATIVGTMLRQVMLSTRMLDPTEVAAEMLPEGSRARLHLSALRNLWATRPEIVPADLVVLKGFLAMGADDALQSVAIIRRSAAIGLSALELAVLDRLEQHHPSCSHDDLDYRRLITERLAPAAPASTLARHAQLSLRDATAGRVASDGSLCVLSVRDSVTEAEAAFAIVQRWLRTDPTLTPADVGIIVPETSIHTAHLAEVAVRCGLVLSGLPASTERRNVGAELVSLFLQCLRHPTPSMASASLHASILMPWGSLAGAEMARRIMSGEVTPYHGIELSRAGRAMRALLALPAPTTGSELADRLRRLMRRLGGNDISLQVQRAEARGWIAVLLREVVEDEQPPTWDRLIALASSYANGRGSRGSAFKGGIAVLHDAELPKRNFRRLLVLGFNDGFYPRKAGGNPLFLDSEVEAIAAATGLLLPSRQQALDHSLARFQRQLCAAIDQIVLLCSERDGTGKPLVPSASLALIARLIEGVDKPEAIVASVAQVDSAWDALIDWRRRSEPISAVRPDPPIYYDLGRDLLKLRRNDDDTPRPQSPSRLEKLLVSPLAWLLDELGAKHVVWQPENLHVMLRGTLAHGVFEDIFVAGLALPASEAAAAQVPTSLLSRIGAEAPFLLAPEWEVERQVLQAEIARAARHWARVLADLGASVVANEFWLNGELLGHPVHGKADCLLLLADGQPIVVDHKKSGSGTRRKRLRAGCDLQVELYRRMRPRARDANDGAPIGTLSALWTSVAGPAVAYHMMNDGGVLVNGLKSASAYVEDFSGDIAELALAQLDLRFKALRSGQLHTNASADGPHFYKRLALGTYALTDSPLIGAFTRQNDTPSAFLGLIDHE